MHKIIRISPQEDGTFRASLYDHLQEEYKEISSVEVCNLLATEQTYVEVAVNDRDDKWSHWESKQSLMNKI